MGGGTWSVDNYARTTGAAAKAGTSFAYSSSIRSGHTAAGVHPLLDPKKTAGAGSPLAGQIVREARDNAEHPNSVPVLVAFDETGSMGHVPMQLQKKLPELFGLLLRKGYLTDPQLAIGAYGDADNDEVAPLQIGQFESDNRADETLDSLYLEGNGGGNGHESAAYVWLYAALHTATDAWEKRGRKGYLFTIGDETTGGVSRNAWARYVAPELEADLSAAQVAKLASEKWEVYHLIINNFSAQSQGSVEHYTRLLGADHVIVLEDPNAAAETIALAIGLVEGSIDLDEGLEDLVEIGSGASSGMIGKALAKVGSGGRVAVAESPADLAGDAASRL